MATVINFEHPLTSVKKEQVIACSGAKLTTTAFGVHHVSKYMVSCSVAGYDRRGNLVYSDSHEQHNVSGLVEIASRMGTFALSEYSKITKIVYSFSW